MLVQNLNVRPLMRTQTDCARIESLMRTVPNFLPKDRTLFEFAQLPTSAFFIVNEAGIVGALNIQQGGMADAHITFWDRKLEDKVIVCRCIADTIMEAAGLQGMITAIPSNRRRLIEFALSVGFENDCEPGGRLTILSLPRKELRNGNR